MPSKSTKNAWIIGCWWLLCILLPVGLAAQNTVLDSIFAEAARKKNDGTPSISEMQWLVDYCNLDSTCLWQQVRPYVEAAGDDIGNYLIAYAANVALAREEFDKGLGLLRQFFRHADTLTLIHQVRARYQLGRYHQLHSQQFDSAYYYYFDALSLSETPDYTPLSNIHSSLAELYGKLGETQKEKEHLLQALRCVRKPDVPRISYGTVLYKTLGFALDNEDAPFYNELAAEYNEYLKGKAGKSVDAFHAAGLLVLLQEDASIAKLERIVEQNYATGNVDYGHAINNVELLANAQLRQGNFGKAEKNARRALALNKKANLPLRQFSVYNLLTDIGKSSGNPQIEIEGLSAYRHLRDSLNLANYNQAVGEWEVRYDTKLKETQLAQQEIALLRAQQVRNRILYSGIGLAMLLLGLLAYFQQRIRLQKIRATQEKLQRDQEISELHAQKQFTRLRALIEGQENERKRIVKDLNGGLGGLLTTVRAQIGVLTKSPDDPALQLLDRAGEDVQRIAHDLMPVQLAEAGVVASFRDLHGQLILQGYACELEIDESIEAVLDENQQIMLLRIGQELVHNITKHAKATHIFIQLLHLDEDILLTVEDNGTGFSTEQLSAAGRGIGLQSIYDRTTYLNGTLNIDSEIGKGTTVSLRVPMEKGNFAPHQT